MIIVGKREFGRKLHKYLEIAENDSVLICHRGKPLLKLDNLKKNRKEIDIYKNSIYLRKYKEIMKLLVG